MCFPSGAMSAASRVAKAVEKGTSLDGLPLNTIPGTPRQMSLQSGLRPPPIRGVVLDPTKAIP